MQSFDAAAAETFLLQLPSRVGLGHASSWKRKLVKHLRSWVIMKCATVCIRLCSDTTDTSGVRSPRHLPIYLMVDWSSSK